MKLDPYIEFKSLVKNYKKLSSPDGKTVLITGGSGRIGSVFSSVYLINNFKVIILSRDKKKFQKFKNSLPKNI